MSQNESDLSLALDRFSDRLNVIEQRLGVLENHYQSITRAEVSRPTKLQAPSLSKEIASNSKPPSPPLGIQTIGRSTETRGAAQLLGLAGVGCLLLGIVLLVRLSIDSGWLTPERQLILAAVFGVLLIAVPFFKLLEDVNYISQLPAAGVVVFYITIMGGVFYHQILEPSVAILLVSGVGVLSLVLLEKLESDLYAIISIVGTYSAALLLKTGFPSKLVFFLFLVMWNIVYCTFAIYIKKRSIILLASYLAIGLVSLKVINLFPDANEYLKVAATQFTQFLIFLTAIFAYSKVNQRQLSKSEAWTFFPLALFFYGLEYHLLDKADPNYATLFALLFSLLLLGAYKFSRHKSQAEVESGGVVYTTVTAVFAHSFYFVIFSDTHRILAGLAIIVFVFSFRRYLFDNERFKGALLVLVLVCAYSLSQVLFGTKDVSTEFLVVAGAAYGIIFLMPSILKIGTFRVQNQTYNLGSITLALAHTQIMQTIYRLKDILFDRSWIAPLWIFYALCILFWGLRTSDKVKAQSAFPIIILSLIRFLIVDFERLESGPRILALLGMGGLIFACGYVYKLIPDPGAKPA